MQIDAVHAALAVGFVATALLSMFLYWTACLADRVKKLEDTVVTFGLLETRLKLVYDRLSAAHRIFTAKHDRIHTKVYGLADHLGVEITHGPEHSPDDPQYVFTSLVPDHGPLDRRPRR